MKESVIKKKVQMYKIYINDTLLILVATKDLEQRDKVFDTELIARYSGKKKSLLNYIDMAEKGSLNKRIYIHHSDYKLLKTDFSSLFTMEKAAGGLVQNTKTGLYLLIFRRGFWDLPKGKAEPKETNKEMAIREVKEETGLKNVEIVGKIGVTYHTYRYKTNRRVLKKTHWFLMQTPDKTVLPQKSEDIEKVEWVNIKDFLLKKLKIYRNIKFLLNKHLKSILPPEKEIVKP